MYVRTTRRKNKDGSVVTYLQLAETTWDPKLRRPQARIVHNFGRADHVDRDALLRLVDSIRRIGLGESPSAPAGEMALVSSRPLGGLHVARSLWEEFGVGETLRSLDRRRRRRRTPSHELSLFAMVVHRLLDPGSKRSCRLRWLTEGVYFPDAAALKLEHLYRAMDFLLDHHEEIERRVFERAAEILKADVDLVFFDTTSCYFEIDEEDEGKDVHKGRLLPAVRKRGHNKEGRDGNPQVVIALAVTRDGVPVRSWVFPGNTADSTTVATIKRDLATWKLSRVMLVGDAGMDSEENRKILAEGLGRFVIAVPAGRLKEVREDVLSRAGRFKKIGENLEAKEVVVGDGERRRRYIVCLNRKEEARQHRHRAKLLARLADELGSLGAAKDGDTHTRRVCELLASKRYGRYLTQRADGSIDMDPAKVRKAAQLDGRWVIHTNDDTISTADAACAYKAAMLIESCFRRLKTTGLRIRPVYHWTTHRIVAHVKLCVLALQLQRAAEIRAKDTWRNLSYLLEQIQAVEYRVGPKTIVQTTQIPDSARTALASLGVAMPNAVLEVREPRARA
jgi:transposase